jgi:hypothetical protein
MIISATGLVLSFSLGKKRGAFQEEANCLLTVKRLERKVRSLESKNDFSLNLLC